jgi:hypothetical protein
MECVEAFVECLQSLGVHRADWAKRRLYAYIAAQDSPHFRISQAARAGYWHLDDPCWQPLKDFLKELAGG